MFVPSHFDCNDLDKQVSFIEENSFGILTTHSDGNLLASHIPFLVERSNNDVVLYGHVAKANPHWQSFSQGETLVIFHGAHTYVSPTWYKTPGVPTWNYTAVHVYGEVNAITDRDTLHDIVLGLTDKFERNRPDPWIPDYDAGMLDAIVGFKIQVSKIQGKFKLNQNRSQADRESVIENLGKSLSDNDKAIASFMLDL